MNIKDFKNHYELKTYKDPEDYTVVEYETWKHKIDFLEKFTKVFIDYPMFYITVDEHIWFIHNDETLYFNEEYLDFCIEHKLTDESAIDLYDLNLEQNTIREMDNLETYKQTYEKRNL